MFYTRTSCNLAILTPFYYYWKLILKYLAYKSYNFYNATFIKLRKWHLRGMLGEEPSWFEYLIRFNGYQKWCTMVAIKFLKIILLYQLSLIYNKQVSIMRIWNSKRVLEQNIGVAHESDTWNHYQIKKIPLNKSIKLWEKKLAEVKHW